MCKGFPRSIIDLMFNCYQGINGVIKWGENLSSVFFIGSGLRQGNLWNQFCLIW